MCVRRHFNHKSRILGAGKFEARGFGKKGIKIKKKETIRRSEAPGGGRCPGAGGGKGKRRAGAPPAPAAGDDGPGLLHPSGARRPPPPRPRCAGRGAGLRGAGGTPRGRDALRSGSRPEGGSDSRLRIPAARSPGGGALGRPRCLSLSLFLEPQGSGDGGGGGGGGGARRGACVCPFKSRSASPASQAPGASQKNRMLLICHQTTERK